MSKRSVAVDVYKVIDRAVEDGIARGLHRADKHADDTLTDAQRTRLAEHLQREIMSELAEWLRFDQQ